MTKDARFFVVLNGAFALANLCLYLDGLASGESNVFSLVTFAVSAWATLFHSVYWRDDA